MWEKSENYTEDRPEPAEICGNIVIVRRNFRRLEKTEDFPARWEYEEWQMTKEQYEVYQVLQEETADLSDALIELAEIILGGE